MELRVRMFVSQQNLEFCGCVSWAEHFVRLGFSTAAARLLQLQGCFNLFIGSCALAGTSR